MIKCTNVALKAYFTWEEKTFFPPSRHERGQGEPQPRREGLRAVRGLQSQPRPCPCWCSAGARTIEQRRIRRLQAKLWHVQVQRLKPNPLSVLCPPWIFHANSPLGTVLITQDIRQERDLTDLERYDPLLSGCVWYKEGATQVVSTGWTKQIRNVSVLNLRDESLQFTSVPPPYPCLLYRVWRCDFQLT